MLKLDSNVDVVDNYQFLANMDYLRRVFVEKDVMNMKLVPDRAKVDGLRELLLDYMNFYSDSRVDSITPVTLRQFLVDYEGVPDELFRTYNSRARGVVYSAGQEIIQSVYNKGYAKFFLEYYLAYTELKTKVNNMESNYKKLKKTGYVSNSGRTLYYWPFYYTDSTTNRVYAKKCNMQNIPKIYTSAFTVPKDYFLLWGDFKQIDLRVALNICLADESDPVFTKYLHEIDDKYESVGRSVNAFRNEPFDADKFKADRPKYKEGVLATIYGAKVDTLVTSTKDREFSEALHSYINSNKRYIAYKKTITDAIDSGEPFVCRGYFGFERYIHPQTDRLLDSSLNSPVQSTSGEIMKFFTNEVCSRMYKHVDRHKFFPYLNRHDECLFMVHKDCIPFLYEFYDCTTIQVDDWTPLGIDWDLGYYYGVPDSTLKKQVLAAMTSKPETIVGKSKRLTKYYPTDKIASFNYIEYVHDGKFYRGLFNFNEMLGVFEADTTRSKEEFIFDIIGNHLNNKLYEGDFSRVMIYCSEDTMYTVNGIEVFLSTDNSQTYFYSLEVFNYLLMQYFLKRTGSIPEDLKKRTYRKMLEGVDMLWLI